MYPLRILTWGSKKKPLTQAGFQLIEFVSPYFRLGELPQFLLWVWRRNGFILSGAEDLAGVPKGSFRYHHFIKLFPLFHLPDVFLRGKAIHSTTPETVNNSISFLITSSTPDKSFQWWQWWKFTLDKATYKQCLWIVGSNQWITFMYVYHWDMNQSFKAWVKIKTSL